MLKGFIKLVTFYKRDLSIQNKYFQGYTIIDNHKFEVESKTMKKQLNLTILTR